MFDPPKITAPVKDIKPEAKPESKPESRPDPKPTAPNSFLPMPKPIQRFAAVHAAIEENKAKQQGVSPGMAFALG